MKLSSSTSSRGLLGPLFGDPRVDAVVDDESFVCAMLAAEAALAEASAEAGIVPAAAAEEITKTCMDLDVDIEALGRAAVESGNPVIPLVRLLVDACTDATKPWVHRGATSQDILDTALMVMSRDAIALIGAQLSAARDACATLADEHRHTLTVARTLGQQASPTTFGRTAAGWLIGLTDAANRLGYVQRDRLAVQLGGPVGTLAEFGEHGDAVVSAYARRLGLAAAPLPWHTDRQRVLDLAAALGGVAAAAAKIAVDIVLMAQSEVQEVSLGSLGGSSSMPHKRNPIQPVLVTAAAARVPGLVATLFAAGAAEQERATGAWHSEWQPWRELLSLVGGVASRTNEVLAGLRVDPDRMVANLDASGGLVMADRVATRLSDTLGRNQAHEVVARCAAAAHPGTSFADALAGDPQVAEHLDRGAILALLDPASVIGAASAQIDRALAVHRDAPDRSRA
jgi:3-carboxy-cis,cis-muconate cycloisomerase